MCKSASFPRGATPIDAGILVEGIGFREKTGNRLPASQGSSIRNGRYGLAVLVASLLSALGFAPAYVRAAAGDGWYLDAISKINFDAMAVAASRYGNTWEILLNIHALTCAGWLVGIAHQAFTGTSGANSDLKRKSHKLAGWVLAPFGAAVVVEALVLEFMKGLSAVSGMILMTGLMMGINLTLGIYYAKKRRISLHKAAMSWAAIWSCLPGIIRIFIYMYRAASICPGSFMTLGQGTLTVIVATCPVLIPGAILLGDTKTVIFVVNAVGVAMVFAGDIGGAILQYRLAGTLCLK